MPKVSSGRLDGLHGMRSFAATELFALADDLDRRAADPNTADDPRWLRRRAERVRRLAEQKQHALVHKLRNQPT